MSLSQVTTCLSCQHDHGLEMLLPHLAGVVVEKTELAGERLWVWARGRAEAAACPACGQCSDRVHSRYQRRLADAAIGGRMVVIRLTVRWFFCADPACPAATFAEQVEGLTSRYARRSAPPEPPPRPFVLGRSIRPRMHDRAYPPKEGPRLTAARATCRSGPTF